MESLHKLSLPPQALDRINKLAGDLRLLCAKEVFKETIEGNTMQSCGQYLRQLSYSIKGDM